MLFNSFAFLVFFPIVCIIYFLIPNLKYRNYFLLAVSYYFYMNWEPAYALLLLASTGITYISAYFIEKDERKQIRKLYLVFSLVLNLTILFFFKYFNFAADNISALMSVAGIDIQIPDFNVLLPVGISFYIFQALGYSIDVYNDVVKHEKNFFNYALFVSFFPQLVAGPVERSTNLLQQFKIKHNLDGDRIFEGLSTMVWGFFMKLVVADRCALYVNAVYNNMEQHSGASIALASVLFCFQLYGDFAGYSYIAIGAARVMGFKLMDNFIHPYFYSVSIQDFWKRNHISVTTWFMDYIYYPMIGSSTSLIWYCFAIFTTFFISGFWHGAAWTYVICFSVFGIYLVINLLTVKRQKKFEKRYKLKKNLLYIISRRLITFILVAFALIFFRANNVNDAFMAIRKIFTGCNINLFIDPITLLLSFTGISVIFVHEYFKENKIIYKGKFKYTQSVYISFLIIMILLFGVLDGGQFIYFQF